MNDSKDVIALQTWWKSCLIRISSDAECWITKVGEVGMIQIAILFVLIALAISIVADIREGR